MREIKFRAWDKEKKQMYEDGKYIFSIGNGFEDVTNQITGQSYRDVALMQYTGLRDKNEKEVYEGDIMESKIAKAIGGACQWEVIWNYNGFFLKRYIDGVMDYDLYGMRPDLEVIGNIYENPELLK